MKSDFHSECPKDQPIIVMTRTLDAPRDVVWTAFTHPEHVKRWYGGHGFENPVCEMDVRPGGVWRHVMRTPDGAEYAMEFTFVEVEKPSKLVWRSGREGERQPGGHPISIMTVTLEEDGKRTKWTLVTRFESLAERDRALGIGFVDVLEQGNDKMNDLVTSIAAA